MQKLWTLSVIALTEILRSVTLSEIIVVQNCVRLSNAAFNDLFFFKDLFYQKQFKYAMNIGVVKISGAHL